ncbi:MAG: ASKHA domain-containing protein [Chloroflexota bacterium]
MAKVRFLPDGQTAEVPAGTRLSVAARAAGAFIDAPCGDRGACGKCRVQVEGLLGEPNAAERKSLSADDLAEGWRLACQAEVMGDVSVRVPFGALQTVLTGIQQAGRLQPAVRKVFARLSEPSVEDQRADVARLRDALGAGVRVSLGAARDLGRVLRAADWAVTAVVVDDECVAVEPGDTRDELYGLAFDIGTTTVVGALLDLNSGAEVGIASALNGQAAHGADVISRITHAMGGDENVTELQRAVVGTINHVAAEAIRQAGVPPERVYELTAVGNTTMSHLLLGIDPSALALAPFVAVNDEPRAPAAPTLGVHINKRAPVYVLPNIAGFVGSDTVGVIMATRLHDDERVRLAIDIGTNGEMVLGSRARLLACSTAAGPAFEGAEITFGMRATDGAIDKVWLDDDVGVRTISGARPRGLCGSGLIDAVAEMLRVGLLDESGRLLSREEAETTLPRALSERLVETDHGRAFVLAGKGKLQVYLTQRDVRKLQLAKGAISAGIAILMKELGIGYEDIAEVLLAGAFGNYVAPASSRAIGLVPPFPLSKLISVGNAASVGARLALLSREARQEANVIARRVEHVELSCRADFQDIFVTAMYFPARGQTTA